MATVVLAEQAVAKLNDLIVTHSLPATTGARDPWDAEHLIRERYLEPAEARA